MLSSVGGGRCGVVAGVAGVVDVVDVVGTTGCCLWHLLQERLEQLQ